MLAPETYSKGGITCVPLLFAPSSSQRPSDLQDVFTTSRRWLRSRCGLRRSNSCKALNLRQAPASVEYPSAGAFCIQIGYSTRRTHGSQRESEKDSFFPEKLMVAQPFNDNFFYERRNGAAVCLGSRFQRLLS